MADRIPSSAVSQPRLRAARGETDARRTRVRDWIATIPILLLLPALLLPFVPAGASGTLRYVSPFGSDADTGTFDHPWRTVRRGLTSVTAGDTLYLRGGIYVENVTGMTIRKGTLDQPITVERYPGERPVIQGLLWLTAPDYWTLDGIDVTWNPANTDPTKHMVKITNGVGWVMKNAEIWGARSFAGLLVAGTVVGQPSNWLVTDNCIHDTYPSNGTNRDHNMYINTGIAPGPGVIERNLAFNATNGANIKLGGASATSGAAANVVVRYNTLYNAAHNLAVIWAAHDNVIERNIIGRLAGTNRAYGNIRGYELAGLENVTRDNIAFDANRFIYNDAASIPGVQDRGGNLFPADPRFDSVTDCVGFRPQAAAAAGYGHLAGKEPAAATAAPPDPAIATPAPATPAPTVEATPDASSASPTDPTATPDPALQPSATPIATAAPPAEPTASPIPEPVSTEPPPSTPEPPPPMSPTPDPTPAPAATIALRSMSSASGGPASVLSIPMPEGVASGDVLLASVDALGKADMSPPAGWALVERNSNGATLTKATYVHVASSSEPASYAWRFSKPTVSAATILAFRGVEAARPIADAAGRANPESDSLIAPAVSTDAPGTMLVGLYSVATSTRVKPPDGMTERSEISAGSADPSLTQEVATETRSAVGSTGKKVAFAETAARSVAQLIALRPAQ